MKTHVKKVNENSGKVPKVTVTTGETNLDLFSKNPSVVLETLEFLFTRTVLTDSDKKTVKKAMKTPMNQVIFSSYVSAFIFNSSLPVLRANNNSLFAFKFLPADAKEKFYCILAQVAAIDLDARLLAGSLLNKNYYNFELVEALFYADFRTEKVEQLHETLLNKMF